MGINKYLIVICIILISIIVGIAYYLYFCQKKEYSLYNKVTRLIQDEDIKKMIDTLSTLTLSILSILLILLVLSTFIPSIAWGWLDRNTLITTVATIIGGFFGFIGSAIGIIGTYGGFYLGEKKAKDIQEAEYKRNVDRAYQATYYMIINSIKKTNYVIEEVMKKYDVLKKDSNVTCLTGNIMEDLKYISETDFTKVFQVPILEDKEVEIVSKFKDEIISILNSKNYSKLVYDENWYENLCCFDEDLEYISGIIEWINILRYDEYYDINEFITYRELMIINIERILKKVPINNDSDLAKYSCNQILENIKKTRRDRHISYVIEECNKLKT